MPTVLIVEDETMVLILAESLIQSAGYVSAAGVTEAVTLIETPDNKIDIVVTDLTLGDQQDGGFDVGRAVQKSRPGIPVIYASGRRMTDGMQALFIEPNAFLPKPYTDAQLTEIIASLLRQG